MARLAIFAVLCIAAHHTQLGSTASTATTTITTTTTATLGKITTTGSATTPTGPASTTVTTSPAPPTKTALFCKVGTCSNKNTTSCLKPFTKTLCKLGENCMLVKGDNNTVADCSTCSTAVANTDTLKCCNKNDCNSEFDKSGAAQLAINALFFLALAALRVI